MSKVMESQVGELLALMRSPDASVDVKVAGINDVKSGIKHFNVPDASVPQLFDILRLAMQSQNATLVTSGFGTLGHLLKRLNLQEPRHIASQGARTIPVLLDRLGDQKERHRALAAQCLSDVWKACPQDVEKSIRDVALASKNSRMKENAIHWIAKMSKEQGLQFKPFVPRLVEALEDADGVIRETAKMAVVELFRTAPGHAKADLKKQLTQRNVRKTIATYIITHLELSPPLDMDLKASVQSVQSIQSLDYQENVPRKETYAPTEAYDRQPSSSTNQPLPSEHDVDQLEPAYVDTQRELDEIFRSMHPCFEGRESEQNWISREKSVLKIRRITKGNAPRDFTIAYLAGIKGLLDGILKTVNSLRTTVSSNGCSTIQEIAKTAGSGLDPMVEILLQNLVKLCGGTKKISSQNGNITVDKVLANVSYHVRVMQHVWAACQDKNVQPRQYATGWLKTMLTTHGQHKSHIEHTGGLELAEKCIKKGLADANPAVREGMRSTFWVFAKIWPEKAEAIISTLDSNSKRLLEKDPGNPNSPSKPQLKASASMRAPALLKNTSNLTGPPPRISLKEAIAARKKAAAVGKELPPRPGSAQSSFTPLKPPGAAPSLSSAPVRPLRPSRKAETARPVTADPYARRNARLESPAMSPGKGNDEELTLVIPAVKPAVSAKTPQRVLALTKPAFDTRSPSKPIAPTQQLQPTDATATSSDADELEILKVYEDPEPASDDVEAAPVIATVTEKAVEAGISTQLNMGQVSPPVTKAAPVSSSASFPILNFTPKSISTPKVEDLEHFHHDDWRKVVAAESPKILPEAEIPKGEVKARRLLDSGIAKIRSRTLDPHGFRMLQGLARNHPVRQALQENNGEEIPYDIWDDGAKFGELLISLLDYLEAPIDGFPTQTAPGKTQDLKMQATIMTKILLRRQRPLFAPYYSRTLCAILKARKDYDYQSHIVSALEEVSEDIVTSCNPTDGINPILTLIEAEEAASGNQTTCMGLYVLGSLLHNMPQHRTTLEEEQKERLGRLAVRCLNANDPVLRRAVVQLCLELYDLLRANFWPLVSKVTEDHQSLLTYYIAKREKEGAGSIL